MPNLNELFLQFENGPYHSIYRSLRARFDVLRTKDLHSPKWNHDSLLAMIISCRESYHQYGSRSLIDKYDEKAAVYVVRATYHVNDDRGVSHEVNEWLSSRIVPGLGDPIGAGELEIYSICERGVDFVVRDKIFSGDFNFWNYVFASSRLCGVDPKFSDSTSAGSDIILTKKNRYSAECYALLNYQFTLTYGSVYRYMTGIISDNLVDRVMAIDVEGKHYKPEFTLAHEALGLSSEKLVKLNRNIYSYKFPLYWFERDQLWGLLKDLIDLGFLTENSIQTYLDTNRSFREIRENPGQEGALLGRLLTINGRINGSHITGEQLRVIIDQCVNDKPSLRITSGKVWDNSILEVLKNAKILEVL